MKRIFVFDLDDTLGKKTPAFPAITKINADHLRELTMDNLMCIATSRPKSLTRQGMRHGGIDKDEMDLIFPVGVYEDGLIAESNGEIVYNALEHAKPLFRDIKNAFFDETARKFFEERGFFLVPNMDVEESNGKFLLVDYQGKFTGDLPIPKGLIPLYRQDNIVKEVYKAPRGFLDNNLLKLEPVFQEVACVTREHLTERFQGWSEAARLVVWHDAIDLYPYLDVREQGIYLKGLGLELAMKKFEIPKDIEVFICGDGTNDIPMVEWAAKRFSNYRVVCPSNVSAGLSTFLSQSNINYKVLSEDCTRFAEGLVKFIG